MSTSRLENPRSERKRESNKLKLINYELGLFRLGGQLHQVSPNSNYTHCKY